MFRECFSIILTCFLTVIIMVWTLEVLHVGDDWMEKVSDSAYKAWLRERMIAKVLRCDMARSLNINVPSGFVQLSDYAEEFNWDIDKGIIIKRDKATMEAKFPVSWIGARRKEIRASLPEAHVLKKWIEGLQNKPSPAENSSLQRRLFACLYEDLDEEVSFMGCEGVIYPEGITFNMLLFNWHFPCGCFEDFFFTIGNNHTILQMFLSTKGHSYSRYNRKVSYFFLSSVLFIISYLIDRKFSDPTTRIIFKAGGLAPLLKLSAYVFRIFLTCPCFQPAPGQKPTKVGSYFMTCGELFGSIGAVVGGIGILLAAATQISMGGASVEAELGSFFGLVVVTMAVFDSIHICLRLTGCFSLNFIAFDEAKAKKTFPSCFNMTYYCCCGCLWNRIIASRRRPNRRSTLL